MVEYKTGDAELWRLFKARVKENPFVIISPIVIIAFAYVVWTL